MRFWFRAYVSKESSDEPAQTLSLSRAIPAHTQKVGTSSSRLLKAKIYVSSDSSPTK